MGLHRLKASAQSTEWENSSACYSHNRVLISTIYKEFKNLNTKRTNNTINKWANEQNKEFSKEEV
jgi:hypothetical protein